VSVKAILYGFGIDLLLSLAGAIGVELVNSLMRVEPSDRDIMLTSILVGLGAVAVGGYTAATVAGRKHAWYGAAVGALAMATGAALVSSLPRATFAAMSGLELALTLVASIPAGAVGGYGARVLK
jgi:hypothetical protein